MGRGILSTTTSTSTTTTTGRHRQPPRQPAQTTTTTAAATTTTFRRGSTNPQNAHNGPLTATPPLLSPPPPNHRPFQQTFRQVCSLPPTHNLYKTTPKNTQPSPELPLTPTQNSKHLTHPKLPKKNLNFKKTLKLIP